MIIIAMCSIDSRNSISSNYTIVSVVEVVRVASK